VFVSRRVQMSVRKRAARVLLGVAIGAVVLCAATTGTAVAADDDGELVDVGKTVVDLERKMADLREHGRSARKGELSAAAACGAESPETIFSSWGDGALYVPAPGGDAETLDQWTLNKHTGRAENSPFRSGGGSLFLEDKGQAISPAMCVSVDHPTIRLFAANTGDEESELEVEILYEGLDGKIKKLKVAKLRGKSAWAPTTIIPLHVNVLGAASEDGLTAIAVKFKAKDVKVSSAGWKIDDLCVDPLKIW
jgi:hypothetical protein